MAGQGMAGGLDDAAQKKKRGRPPGFAGTPNRDIKYVCSTCALERERDDLLVKRVLFSHIGRGGKLLKSRVRAWVCTSCLEVDADWNAEKFSASPGMKDTKLAKPTED